MEDKQTYTFERVKHGPGTYSVSKHSYICGDDSSWVPILLQFASFLDESGYVGVYESISMMLEEE